MGMPTGSELHSVTKGHTGPVASCPIPQTDGSPLKTDTSQPRRCCATFRSPKTLPIIDPASPAQHGGLCITIAFMPPRMHTDRSDSTAAACTVHSQILDT